MSLAHLNLMSALGRRVTLESLASLVSAAHGERTFSASQLSQYQRGDAKPPVDVIAAYAAACGVDPGWLAFGDLSEAPVPVNAVAALTMALRDPRQRKRKKKRA